MKKDTPEYRAGQVLCAVVERMEDTFGKRRGALSEEEIRKLYAEQFQLLVADVQRVYPGSMLLRRDATKLTTRNLI